MTGSTPPNPLVAGDFGEIGVNGELVEAEAGPIGEEEEKLLPTLGYQAGMSMCCSVLSCVVVCCSVLQCVAVSYSVWQCIAVFCCMW